MTAMNRAERRYIEWLITGYDPRQDDPESFPYSQPYDFDEWDDDMEHELVMDDLRYNWNRG